MAAPRLPFLYPNFMRAVRSCEPSTHRSFRFPSSRGARIDFHNSRRRNHEAAYHRRYGPAAEPNLPPPPRPKDEASQPAEVMPKSSKPATPPETPPDQSRSQPQPEPQPETQSLSQDAKATAPNTSSDAEIEVDEGEEDSAFEPRPREENTPSKAAADPAPDAEQSGTQPNSKNLFEDVEDAQKPSPSKELMALNTGLNLRAGPYVHHFDTYTLVRDLAKGGFTEDQSITIMKAVRGLLHKNLDIAKDSLISKSDVENESYLFKAACSELQSSLQTSRNSQMQTQRASRTQLEHEADIISQRLNQELAGLKDDIQGMFNDHKISTREQQRSIDTSIQELNYKITVSLNSDGKSEIEGLRWILTRRAAFALAISAAMIIAFLKYSSVYQARKTEEAQKSKGLPPKEIAEARAVHDAAQSPTTIQEAIISESLG